MKFIFLYAILLSCFTLQAQVKFNGNLERVDNYGKPVGWDMSYNTSPGYKVQLDSTIKQQGKYSISIGYENGKVAFGAINHPINQTFHGKTLILTGFIKTENITEGFASLWLSVEGENHQIIESADMHDKHVSGTTEWKEYYVQVPYHEDEAISINACAYLSGKGKMWVDSLRLYLDENPIEKAPLLASTFAAVKDTSFSKRSGINTISINKRNITYLTLLGQLWGFLKYHHPAIAKGYYNWDAELFRLLPKFLNSQSEVKVSNVLEHWVDELGKPTPCSTCRQLSKIKNIVVKPDYGSLFNNTIFSKTLTSKLQYILANRNTAPNYYIDISGAGNPQFTHEKAYTNMLYPDAGYRLLALYRYWNMIQYFFPSRNLITEGWNNILPKYIPELIQAKNKTDYAKTIVKLIAEIHDTHAFIGSKVIEEYQGNYRLPFQAKFIEGKLVVTGYYRDTLNVKEKFKIGDIITSINGTSVENLIKKYLPLTPASNYLTQLRDLPGTYLLRSNNPQFNFELLRNNQSLLINCRGVELSKINYYGYDWNYDNKFPSYDLINSNIGYVFSGRYKNKNLDDIKKKFVGTKGIIVDMRSYPSDEMEYIFGNYIKPFSSAFVRFTNGSIGNPGLFTYSIPVKNGAKTNDNYKGKVVVIVNELTQSNAEFVTMAFQSSPNVTVIGSTTAGADGNISKIVLPGGISTNISGLGVFYPDGTNAQRAGVKIDYFIQPTLQGIKAGRDELLEKAEQLIIGN